MKKKKKNEEGKKTKKLYKNSVEADKRRVEIKSRGMRMSILIKLKQ